MGGKHKQAQRTKGNTRPSSSSRSAERLLGSGARPSLFIGFGTELVQLASVKHATGSANETDSDVAASAAVDGDCRLLMRKMAKKDSVTRLKALQEFGSFVESCDEEILKGALPFWPRLFNKLSSDYDRRVREALYIAHSKLVSRMKRNLAPHLKNIIGSWLMGQCDLHPPAATAAKAAFRATFHPLKQVDALVYCKDEVLAQIVDVLYKQTPQILIDLEIAPADEAEATHERMVSMALSAFALFLDSVPKSEHDNSLDVYEKFVSDAKFWKYAKSQTANIRSAWFGVVSSLCRARPSAFEPHLSRLCPLVLGNLDEDDPVASPLVWAAVLHVTVAYESCWTHVNIQKAVIPKLMSVLKNGFNGNAASICRNLLPFLSRVPLDLLKDVQKFYDGFFINLRLGMSRLAVPKVQSSISECSAIVTSFVECIRYVAVTNAVFANDLVRNHLLPVVESSFVEMGSTLASTPLYSLVGDYLQSLHSRSEAVSLEDAFWEALSVSCLSVVENTDENVDVGLKRLSDMFASFTNYGCTAFMRRKEKSLQVRFVDGDKSETLRTESVPRTRVIDSDSSQSSAVFAASKLCAAAQNNIVETGSVPHLIFLVQMTSMFACSKTFEFLLSEACESGGEASGSTLDTLCHKYFDFLLNTWLVKFKRNRLEMDARKAEEVVEGLISMVFVLYDLMDANGQLRVLLELCLLKDVVVLEQTVYFLMKVKRDDPVVRQWLKGSELSATLQMFTEDLEDCNPYGDASSFEVTWRLLGNCLGAGDDSEPILSIECLTSILEKLCVILSDVTVTEEVLFAMGKLAIGFFCNVPGCWQISACEELLLAFFIASCTQLRSVEVAKVVDDLVVEGTSQLVKNQGGLLLPGRFLFKAARHVHYLLLSRVGVKSEHPEAVTKAAVCLISTVNRALSGTDETPALHDTAANILDLAVLSPSELKKIERALWEKNVLDHIMQGELTFHHFPAFKDHPNESGHFPMLASAHLVSEVLLELVPSDEGQSSFPIGDLLGHFLTVLYASTYCKVVTNRKYKSVDASEVDELKEFGCRLQNTFCCLLDRISSSEFARLYSECLNQSLESGLYWSYALVELDRHLSRLEFIADRTKVLTVDCVSHSEGSLHNVQLMSSVGHVGGLFLQNLLDCVTSTMDPSYLGIITSVLRAFSCNDPNVEVAAVDVLLKWRREERDVFLFEADVLHDWNIVSKNVEFCKLLSVVVSGSASSLASQHWDFIMCSLGSWVDTCKRNRASIGSNQMTQTFVFSVARLSAAVASTMERLRTADGLPPNLITEWDQFFAVRIFAVLLGLFVGEVERLEEVSELSHGEEYVLESLARTIQWVPLTALESSALPVLLAPEWDDKDCEATPVNVKTTLNHLCPMLGSSKRSVQFGAYHALSRVVSTLSLYDAKKVIDGDGEKEESEIPWPLLSALSRTRHILEEMLVGFNMEEPSVVPLDSELHSCAVGFLLSWRLTLCLFSSSTSEMRSKYASFFRESKMVAELLNCLFCLMPENVILHTEGDSTVSPKQGASRPTMFSEQPLLDPTAPPSPLEVQHLACSVYFGAVRHIPALVREWFNGLDRRTASLVDRFTSRNVSPLLCKLDIVAIQKTDRRKLRNMTIKARPSVREVVAACSVEDNAFEIVVKLSDNHPLSAITIEAGRPVGVSNSQWSYWTLQLTTFLMHQNGSILDGLLLWKRNIDKRFEGVQECYICFYVLHSTTCQLPKLLCRTCKKKFHSSCLYKWFSTSGNSTCPLCRSIF